MGRFSLILHKIGKYIIFLIQSSHGNSLVLASTNDLFSILISIYKVFDLKNYTMLYSISDKHVQEIKIR